MSSAKRRNLIATLLFVLALLALTPAVFWASYGTANACEAFRDRVAEEMTAENGGVMGTLSGLAVSGAVGLGRISGSDCLQALWELETDGVDAAVASLKDD